MTGVRAGTLVVGVVGVAALAGLAWAKQPPRPRSERVYEENKLQLESALGDCSHTIATDGGFGAIRVAVEWREDGTPAASIDAMFGIKTKYHRCIRDALATAQLTRNDAFPRSTFGLELGDPAAVLPDTALAAWQRAVDRRDRKPIMALLPSYMTLSPRGCIRVAGPEPLNEAFVRWTRKLAPRELNTLTAILEPLSDDWWFDSAYGVNDGSETHEEICLEHLSPAASEVRNHIEAVDQASFAADLYVEYTVDRDGKAIGAIGVCYALDRADLLSDSERIERRRTLEATLRMIDHRKRSKLERITLHSRPHKPLDIRVEPASAPIAKGASPLESKCGALAAKAASEEPQP